MGAGGGVCASAVPPRTDDLCERHGEAASASLLPGRQMNLGCPLDSMVWSRSKFKRPIEIVRRSPSPPPSRALSTGRRRRRRRRSHVARSGGSAETEERFQV